MEKELKIHQNLIENKVFMDEMIRGLRFDSNFIARVGKEGRFTDETGLAIGDLPGIGAGETVGTLGIIIPKLHHIILFPLLLYVFEHFHN